jgi:hypothetical protein
MTANDCRYSPSVLLDGSRRGDAQLRANDWREFRDHIQAADSETATRLLTHGERVLIFSRHHWLEYQGTHYDRQGLSSAFASASAVAPADWSDEHGELVFLLYILGTANLGLEQVETVLSTEQVAELVSSREALYRSGRSEDEHERDTRKTDQQTLAERAYGLRDLRYGAEKQSYRYSVIDGARWHLNEGLLPRADVATEEVPGGLLDRLGIRGSGTAALRKAATAYIECDGHAEQAVIEVMRFALEDSGLGVDHVTITGPKQVGFPVSECLGQRDNIYRRTEVRDGVDLKEFEAQLGHDSPERLTRVIGARMQVLKLKSAKQFFGSGCMGGEGSEKFGDYMIYANEDSHYLGHKNGGISTGGRAPIPLDFERDGSTIDLPGMFGDFRAVRLSHEEVDRFDVLGLARVIQYAAWLGAILNTAYESGAAISADAAVASVA